MEIKERGVTDSVVSVTEGKRSSETQRGKTGGILNRQSSKTMAGVSDGNDRYDLLESEAA